MKNRELAEQIKPLFSQYLANPADIELVSLATTDGFPVLCMNNGFNEFEEDKLAAAASTLYSVSGAVSRQILGKTFDVSFIETQAGNIAFVALSIAGKDYVLAMSAGESVNIASLRLFIKRLAQELVT